MVSFRRYPTLSLILTWHFKGEILSALHCHPPLFPKIRNGKRNLVKFGEKDGIWLVDSPSLRAIARRDTAAERFNNPEEHAVY